MKILQKQEVKSSLPLAPSPQLPHSGTDVSPHRLVMRAEWAACVETACSWCAVAGTGVTATIRLPSWKREASPDFSDSSAGSEHCWTQLIRCPQRARPLQPPE